MLVFKRAEIEAATDLRAMAACLAHVLCDIGDEAGGEAVDQVWIYPWE